VNTRRFLSVILAATIAPAAFAQQDEGKKKGSAGLEALKTLAGEWVALGEDGKPTEKTALRIRVTAAGSAVHETVLPGTEHEMVTLYHMDGNDLVLTHYCMLGNQPRMKAVDANATKNLVFKCAGGTNMKSENDEHMHEAHISILGKDRIKTRWREFKDGKEVFVASFNLVRKK